MVIDTSALMAVLLKEPGYEQLLGAMIVAPDKRMSAFTWLETAASWLHKTRNPDAITELRRLVNDLKIDIIPFDREMSNMATKMYVRHGKGIASPGLNLGDCVVAALAQTFDEAVLCTTDEFARSGVKSVFGG